MKGKNNKGTPSKDTGAKNGINLDYDYNSEYGDEDIPDIDKPGYNYNAHSEKSD